MKFSTSSSENILYPLNVEFNTESSLLGLEVIDAIDLNTKHPVTFKVQNSLTTELYEIADK